MTFKLVVLVLLCLIIGTAVAQEPKVTSPMSKDLPENPGREVLMIRVEHAPRGSSAITLTPGRTVYEGPDDVHVVDRNASGTNPAKILVLYKGAPALVPAQ